MRVLITGGAGYVGSATALEMVRAGHDVLCLDPKGEPSAWRFAARSELRQKVQWLLLDCIADRDAIAEQAKCVDAIVHLAFVVGGPACRREPKRAADLAVEGTQTVVDAAKGSGCVLLFSSSDVVYGNEANGTCAETFSCKPVDSYGELKLRCEGMVGECGRSIIVRLPSHFGVSPTMRGDLIVHAMAADLYHHGTITLFEPEITRALIHVRDSTSAIRLLLESAVSRPSESHPRIYNVASGSWTKREVAAALVHRFGGKVCVDESAGSDPNKRNFMLDCRLIQEEVGFVPMAGALEYGTRELKRYIEATCAGD
ncbi:MAG: NAD(P)-dependent oxidoreductase [Thermoguttaceae bacterium]|jgi:nucleoside-diphosphate-sugar epimerase